MVQSRDDMAASERTVFEFNMARNLNERCSSVDAYDQVVVLGVATNKHHVLPFLKEYGDRGRVSSADHGDGGGAREELQF